MKKQLLLPALLLLGIAALTSCKKDNDDAVNPSKQQCTLDRKIQGADSTQYTYDSDNRVIKEQTFNSSGVSQGYTLYSYSSSKITEKRYNGAGTLTSQVDYKLNGNNNAEYSVYTTDGADYDNSDTTWYTYDSGRHNTRRVTKNTTVIIGISTSTYDTTWYTYTGENLTKKEVKEDGGAIETTIYSYGSDNAYSEFLAPEATTARNLFGDYRELALAATKSVNDRLIIGVRGKFLMGLTDITTQESKNTLYTDPDGMSLSGHSQFTLLTSGLINDEQIKVSDFFGFQNLGLAADLGGRYNISDKFSVACNVTNLGFINWKKDVKNYRVNGDYTYTGYIMHDSADIANADWQSIVDTLETIFKPQEDSKAYRSWLTPTVYISGNYLLRPDLNLYSSFAMDIYHGVRPTFTIGGTQTFGQTIQATVSYSVTPNSYFNLGGGFAVRGGPAQFYIVCDNIIGMFDPYAVKYFNARIGINFLLGKVDSADSSD